MNKDILSDEHIREIGRLVVHVSRLDSLMTDLVTAFSDTPIVYTIIMIHHQQFANKFDCLRAIMKVAFVELEEAKFEQLLAPIKKAKDVADFRNTIVHAMWSVEPDGSVLAVRLQARGELTRSRLPVSAEDIRKQADAAAALVVEIAKMRDHFLERETPQSQSSQE